jgi:hypothetical protein
LIPPFGFPDQEVREHRERVRMTERIIAPQKLTFIDVVPSMHNHADHLDAQTLRPILASNPKTKLVIPEANRALVAARPGRAASGRPVVACRFDMLEFNTPRRRRFAEECDRCRSAVAIPGNRQQVTQALQT